MDVLWIIIVIQFFGIILLAFYAYRQRESSNRDPLTGLYNRKVLNRNLIKMEESERTFSILMLDIDHFKMINDDLGHVIGDKILKDVSRRIVGSVRPSDLCFRYGGEEFLVLFPDTELDDAVQIAIRLQEILRKHYRLSGSVPLGENMLKVTVSMGLSFRSDLSETADEVLKMADECLYKAKDLGRDSLFFSDGKHEK